jgi:hypothetical protein
MAADEKRNFNYVLIDKALRKVDRPNAGHWSEKFSGFKEKGFNRSWNWPSFFLGPIWYIKKGMWARGLIFMGLFATAFLMVPPLVTSFESISSIGPIGTGAVVRRLLSLSFHIYWGKVSSHDYFQYIYGIVNESTEEILEEYVHMDEDDTMH